MVASLNVNEKAYGMMLKTKRILTASSKRSSETFQKFLPFLMRQRKDKMKGMEAQFTESHPPGPPRVRPFLRSGLINENSQTVSVNSNVSITRRLDACLIHCEIYVRALKKKRRKHISIKTS